VQKCLRQIKVITTFTALKCTFLNYKQNVKHLYYSMTFDKMHIKRQRVGCEKM